MEPRVEALHRKSEIPGERGLPKPEVPEIEVAAEGVLGDFNRWRHEEGHDDPTAAVLLMPTEMLEELRTEGWPVRPGDLGENIATRGIPYGALEPGMHLRLGSAELTVTRPCDPCNNLYQLPYVGEARGPEFLKVMLDRRGWYARVDRAGTIHRGDRIQLRR